jgi:hypothetical protein
LKHVSFVVHPIEESAVEEASSVFEVRLSIPLSGGPINANQQDRKNRAEMA